MTRHFLPLFVSFSLCFIVSFAQDKPPVKFGNVSIEDFDVAKFNLDTSFGAIIIADVGSSSFQGNSKGWFSLIYKHQRRIKIINKKGLDLATVNIPLYISTKTDAEEKVESLKASCYNIENGKVVETRLPKESIFKEKLDANHLSTKFTMPAVKDGSIIEYSYTVNSDFLFNLQPWTFQGDFPRVWSEYELDLPQFFEYVFLARGYNPYDIKTTRTHSETYNIRQPGNIGAASSTVSLVSENTVSRWVIKNVPVFKEESFVSSMDNHLSAIEFQMSAQQFPNNPRRNVMGSWNDASADLLKDESFGFELNMNNNWLNSDVDSASAGATSQVQQAKQIFEFVKTHFKCNGIRGIYLSKPLKDVLKSHAGYVADINLLLVAMLNHKNLDAKPVILSTKRHGFTNEYYPLMNRFNYVVCKVLIDGVDYYMDASEPYLGFNRLPAFCFNGHARVVSKISQPLYFFSDSLKEQKSTSTMLFNDPAKPGRWTGFVNTDFGYYESCTIRENRLEKGDDNFDKQLKSQYTGEYSIDEIKYEQEKDDDLPLKMSHSLAIDASEGTEIIYFNPMIKEGFRENYFTSEQRKYPVEIPYQMDESYTFKIEVPEGFVVDELPKSTKVSLNEDEGFFEYIIAQSGSYIDLTTRVKLMKANFEPSDYETLRNFFAIVVKKHAEQIVFKKSK